MTDKELAKAKNIVFRLLNLRSRSEKEIKDKLKHKKIHPAVIDQVIRHFKQLALIDDRKFAQSWISYRLARPWGIQRIEIELKEKGINSEIIRKELKENFNQAVESKTVLELAKKRVSKYPTLAPEKKKQRLFNYLTRRGFSLTSIYQALKQYDQ